jgi:hypothetical protein
MVDLGRPELLHSPEHHELNHPQMVHNNPGFERQLCSPHDTACRSRRDDSERVNIVGAISYGLHRRARRHRPRRKKALLYLVPGNHDVSNALGFYRAMTPRVDKTSMLTGTRVCPWVVYRLARSTVQRISSVSPPLLSLWASRENCLGAIAQSLALFDAQRFPMQRRGIMR